jgi:hypothetical protein
MASQRVSLKYSLDALVETVGFIGRREEGVPADEQLGVEVIHKAQQTGDPLGRHLDQRCWAGEPIVEELLAQVGVSKLVVAMTVGFR